MVTAAAVGSHMFGGMRKTSGRFLFLETKGKAIIGHAQ